MTGGRYLPALVVALALAGCSPPSPEDATLDVGGAGQPWISTEDSGRQSTEPNGAPGAGSGTAELRPCELLAGDELAQLSLGTTGIEDEVAGQRGCLWTASGSHTVTVSIAEQLGLADVQSSSPTKELKVGTHNALRSTGGLSSCAINLEVTTTSRVDVISSANGDEPKACDIAKHAAELVEPKLPT